MTYVRQKENRKNTRIETKDPLAVIMGSMGGDIRYEMETSNISTNGFFLSFDKPGRFPFTPSSIMEVWLHLEKESSIFFNGKMARVILPEDPAAKYSGPGIAVKIVQINQDNMDKLNAFIAKHIPDEQKENLAS